MKIEYYKNGKIAISSNGEVVESRSPLMQKLARFLQESGFNHRPIGNTLCGQFIELEHPIEFETPDREESAEDDVEDIYEGDGDIEIVYTDKEDSVRKELPVHLL